MRPSPDQLVFNVVWTGTVFDHLEPFVASQLAQDGARFRFVANACPADQVAALERFAAAHPGRVVEVLEVSTERMVRHGDALDEVLRTRHDGDWFAFVDPDIAALGPYLERFRALLDDADAVTSGAEVWSDRNVRPVDHPGVSGEHFFDQDGYTFGSPHFAIYRRAPLVATMDRWSVGFSNAGNDLTDAARARLVEVGRSYWIYDTAKIVNVLLQADGHRLVHEEHPALLHIGAVSHLLAPPSSAPASRGRPPGWGEGPDWGEQPGQAARHQVASFAAAVLGAALAGHAVPEVPADADPHLVERLHRVRTALAELVAAHPPLEREPAR
ncbi:MAG: hypothetical protein R2746_08395 [Acidimicrobiales bacterium]